MKNAHLKRLFLSVVLVFNLCYLCETVIALTKKDNMKHKTFLVNKVNVDNSIELSNGVNVYLLGIKADEEKLNKMLNEVLVGKKVIYETDPLVQDESYCYVFVWGGITNIWEKYIPRNSFEFYGILDAQDGIGSPKKGLSLFLNATLIKSGVAKTDTNRNFKYMEQFIKWEQMSVDKLGNKIAE